MKKAADYAHLTPHGESTVGLDSPFEYSGDVFQEKIDSVFGPVDGVTGIVDDIHFWKERKEP